MLEVLFESLVEGRVCIIIGSFVVLLQLFFHFLNIDLFSLPVYHAFFFHIIHGVKNQGLEQVGKTFAIILLKSLNLIIRRVNPGA